jgi:DNA replication protein DnaC
MEALNQSLNQVTAKRTTSPAFRLNGAAEGVCVRCGDLGVIGWKTPYNYPIAEVQFCDCIVGQQVEATARRNASARQQRRLEETFARAGIPAHFQGLTIETLTGLAGRDPEKTDALAAARSMVETGYANGKPGVFLFGEYGAGKTGALSPVLRHYLDRGHTALWLEFYDFVDEIQSKYGAGGDAADAAMQIARNVDWLLLDDVGDLHRADRATGFAETADRQRLLYQLVNYRHNHVKPMLITSNLPPDKFVQQFGPRTFERIAESCAVTRIGGRNLRRTAK